MFSSTGPVESKTKTGTLAAASAAFVLSLIYGVWGDAPTDLTEPVATFVFSAVSSAVTGAATWIVSWLTKHTNRTDADAAHGRFATSRDAA
jgi:hypothetical protein